MQVRLSTLGGKGKRWLAILVLGIIGLSGCHYASKEELQQAIDPVNRGDYGGAITRLKELAQRFPQDSRIYYLLGYALLRKGDYDPALENIRLALELWPNYREVIGDVDLANFLAGNSQDSQDPLFKTAIRELQKIIKDYRGSEVADEIRYHKGYLYLMKKEYRKALAAFQEVVEEPPKSRFDLKAQLAMADLYLNFWHQTERGMKIYRRILERHPKEEEAAEALYKLALHHKQMGDMYRERYQALMEFARQWEGSKQFERDCQEARSQAREDAQRARLFSEEAASELRLLLEGYPETPYHSRARELLRDIEGQAPLSP